MEFNPGKPRDGLIKKVDYDNLKESGLLWDLFPYMTGDYQKDILDLGQKKVDKPACPSSVSLKTGLFDLKETWKTRKD